MFLTQLIHGAVDWSLLFADVCGPLGFPCPCNTDGFLGFGGRLQCPGSAFSPIAAAYQTQGMWVQADLLNQIRFSGLGSLAALLYMLSAIGGLIGVALGAPPKMYLWFFMGPPIYHWLIATPYPVKGTEWRVADIPQDQRKVWELAEVGLVNSNWIHKAKSVYRDTGPATTVDVSWAYAYFDHLVSNVVQNLTAWTGLYNLRASTQGTRSGIGPAPAGSDGVAGMRNGWVGDRWWLLSNSKWGMIENITNAKLASPKIRDALATFMASECGDQLMRRMNSSAFLNAMYHKGRASPVSIFQTPSGSISGNPSSDYELVFRSLAVERMPMPRSLRDILKERPQDYSSLVHSLGLSSGSGEQWRLEMINSPWIECPLYLQVLLEAFRWEAGQIYHQFVASAPPGINEQWLGYYLLYGWNVRKRPANFTPAPGQTEDEAAQAWSHLSDVDRAEFLKNLIFVHLVRNEMMIMPTNFTNRKTSATQTEESSEGHLRFIAIKNKFPELYQWALMVPHMQGILLYYLTLAFPFCAMMVVIPGYHKVTFTWMTFWMWTKLWDFGFAMVTSLERSVWAMIGNSAKISGNLSRIAEMGDWGKATVQACTGMNCRTPCSTLSDQSCQFAQVGLSYGGSALQLDQATYDTWAMSMRFFDRALTMAANLDLDLSNSYYVYIMAGLYFSVPVVVGQVVLGAKAGSASLVGNIIGAVGQEAGRQGAAGHQSDMIYRMKAAKAAVGQEAYAKGLRTGGLMDQALAYGNSGIIAGMNRSGLDAAASGARAVSQAANLTRGLYTEASSAGIGALGGLVRSAGGAFSTARDVAMSRDKLGLGNGGVNPLGPGGGEIGSPSPDRTPGNTVRTGLPANSIPSPQAASGIMGGVLSSAVNTGASGTSAAVASGLTAAGLMEVNGGSGGPGSGLSAHAGKAWTAFGMNAVAENAGNFVRLGNYDAAVWGSTEEFKAQQIGAQAATEGFGFGQRQGLFGQSEGRVGSQAEYDARMAAWDAENAYSNQFAALSTALGFFAGGLEAGSKPVDRMGMAMNGDLGSATQASARAVTPGSWMWGRVDGMQQALTENFGKDRVKDNFYTWGIYEAMGSSLGSGLRNFAGQGNWESGGGSSGGDLGGKSRKGILDSDDTDNVLGR